MAYSDPVDIPRSKSRGSLSYYPVDLLPMDGGMSSGGSINPHPVSQNNMQDLMFEEYLSPRRLRELTGVDNLEEVEYLELRVDTSETTLGNFGILVPNLKHLKLSGSSIQSVRDLGSSLDNLQTLWMATTGLEDIDGLSSMCNLRELYLAFNDISDLSPCSMLDDLRTLDLEGNQLDDISQVEFLSLCTKLADLTLRGNPFCDKITPEEYRRQIFSILPNLKNLDDKDTNETSNRSTVTKSGSSSISSGVKSSHQIASQAPHPKGSTSPAKATSSQQSTTNPFTDDWNLINQLVREGTIGTDSVLTDSGYSSVTSPANTAASSSANGRAATARPTSRAITSAGSPFRPLTSMATSASGRLGSSGSSRPSTSRAVVTSTSPTPSSLGMEDNSTAESSSSMLTKGPVLCGNPSRALRRRREFVTSASHSVSREGTASSDRTSSTASPNNDIATNAGLVVGPENAASVAATKRNERIGSVASLGERSQGDFGSLLQDVNKWRSDYQVTAVQRLKEKSSPDVLVVRQGEALDDDDDEEHPELDVDSDDDGRVTSPISPRPPSDPKPANRRLAGPNQTFTLQTPSSQKVGQPPTILAPPLPLPAIGASFRPITSSSSTAASRPPGSRMSSKIQYISAKPSQ